MEQVLAQPRGFCAGVERAIEIVEKALERYGPPVYVRHEIVHNQHVGDELRAKGAVFVDGPEEAPEGAKLIFSADGVAPNVRERAAAQQQSTIDATCPLVTKVHSEAKKYARLGHHILLIGDSTHHQEVVGTYGEAPDCTTVVSVVGNRRHDPELANAETVEVPNPEKVMVLTQTTLSVDDTARTISILRDRFPKLLVPSRDDLCYATKNRQDAVKEIAPHVDLFLVVTSDYSSNGMRLLELADELTGNARRIEGVDDIEETWLKDANSVGVTSAASTPDDLVQEIIRFFRERYAELDVVEEGGWEDITFREPERVAPRSHPG